MVIKLVFLFGLLASLAAADSKPVVTAWYNGCAELWGEPSATVGALGHQQASSSAATLPAYLPEYAAPLLG
jgi:hypothetical protein